MHGLDAFVIPSGKFVRCENIFRIIVVYFKQAVIFTLFHALIQSYIYMFLSFSFVAEAAE